MKDPKPGDRVIIHRPDDDSIDNFNGTTGTIIDPHTDPRIAEEWGPISPHATTHNFFWVWLDERKGDKGVHSWQFHRDSYEPLITDEEIEKAIQSIKSVEE